MKNLAIQPSRREPAKEATRDAWLAAREEAAAAYHAWCGAPHAGRSEPYAMYRAAADREDAAAIALLHAEDGTAVPVRLAAAA